MTNFFAHSTGLRDFSDWQPLATHLLNVAELARQKAIETGWTLLPEAAFAAGLLHDLGKYRPEFQQYIRQLRAKGDPLTFHKQAGVAKAKESKLIPVAFAVYGHHGGIPDKSELEAGLKQPAANVDWSIATADCLQLATLGSNSLDLSGPFHADLLTRLLFSCLVDADWSDTGEFERQSKNLPADPKPMLLDPADRLGNVLQYIARRSASCKEEHIRRIRTSILDACLLAADCPAGLFSLTVPTGGGKTLAGLAFALKHAAKHGLRRVIYVAPYMSILEQNIDVIREALGIGPNALDLFEHYSLAEPPGDDDNETSRMAAARRAENWDSPFIVTTNVQFFESLFSNKPGRCRKLHNIARSVIILDECQTLPPGLVAPTCGMLKQVASELGSTIVLCTATQPAFNHSSLKPDERLDAREIIPANLNLFGQLKRVHVTWPKQTDPRLSWSDVSKRMQAEPSGLCVVNTKKAARAVFDELKNLSTPGLFHLSTGMCPAHRREKLKEIRGRLAQGTPCYVVSTQLIEAGVDVDFPFLMRELAPLESIVQAAGRCNREGRMKGVGGHVLVFRSEESQMPPDRWYNAGRDTLETSFLSRGIEPQLDDPAVIRDYFSRLYHTGMLDSENVQSMRQKYQFKQIAQAYRLIDNNTEAVVVASWSSYRSEIETLLTELRAWPRKSVFRALARFQVNLFPHQRLRSAHLIHEEPSGILVWDGGYDEDAGIVEEMADAFII